MVSRSSHTIMINELIILIMPVATVSFMVVNFVTYDKNSIDKKLQARQFPSEHFSTTAPKISGSFL